MEDTGFIKYKTVHEILNNNGFYGHTAKKEEKGRRITYRFFNIRWTWLTISVTTLKLEPKNPASEKIVINIKFNQDDIEWIENFRRKIENLGKEYARRKKQKIQD